MPLQDILWGRGMGLVLVCLYMGHAVSSYHSFNCTFTLSYYVTSQL